jgi:hypothetical protein
VKKRGKENFEKMFLILELYTGRKTISGLGNTAPLAAWYLHSTPPPKLVAARQLSLYLGGGTLTEISHTQKDPEIITLEKIC